MSSFEDIELQKLNQVVQTFTPVEMNKYKEEVAYIRYLLNLLKKQKQRPQTKKQKEAEKKTEKKIKEGLSDLVNTFTLKKPTTKTHDALPEDVMEDAEINKLSTKYYQDPELGEKNLFESGLFNKYEIDTELSNDLGIVLKNRKTGKVKVSFRGTDKKNINDLEYDARIGIGTEKSHPQYIRSKELVQSVIDKYGKANIENLSGYSKGGQQSYAMGKMFDINTRNFNPWIAGNNITDPEKNQSSEHEIWRTQDDIASFQSLRVQGKNNTKVNVVESNYEGINLYKTHKLENFTSNNGRDGGKGSVIEAKARAIYEHGLEHGELKALHDMIKVNKRTPIKITETGSKSTGTSRGFGLMPPPAKKTNLEKAAEKLNTLEIKAPSVNENKELNYDESLRFLEDYNQDGSDKQNLEQETTSLEERAGLINKRPVGRNIRQQTTDLETRLGLDKTSKNKIFKKSAGRTIRKKGLPEETEIELQDLKSRTLFPPDAQATQNDKTLKNQTTKIEDQIEDLSGTKINNTPNIKKKSYTDYITENNIRDGSHKKSLWKISGGELDENNNESLDEELFTFGNTDEVKDFASKSTAERESILNDMATQQTNLENDLTSFVEEPVHVSSAQSFSKGVTQGLHPTNLLIGLATDKISEGILKSYVDPNIGKQPELLRTTEKGLLSGGLASFITGGALLPEAGAAGVGYLAGDLTARGTYAGLRALGAGQEASVATADVAAGAVGGGAAVATGSLITGLLATGAGAAEGAEVGTFAGPVGIAVGATIGSIIGLGSYFYSRFKHS
tara:strand:- start:118 stop:2487 length:2370 start_codon:yes stop_codon:yes gene_type:complete